jgi:hypothetical protein
VAAAKRAAAARKVAAASRAPSHPSQRSYTRAPTGAFVVSSANYYRSAVAEWGRSDLREEPWEEQWAARARQFLAHDIYEEGSRSVPHLSETWTCEICAGDAREVIGEARINERGFRVLDRSGTEIVAVLWGKKHRGIFAHRRRIGTVERRGWSRLRSSESSLRDPTGEVVALVREAQGELVLRVDGRDVGHFDKLRLDLTLDLERRIDRRLFLAAWLAFALEPHPG